MFTFLSGGADGLKWATNDTRNPGTRNVWHRTAASGLRCEDGNAYDGDGCRWNWNQVVVSSAQVQ